MIGPLGACKREQATSEIICKGRHQVLDSRVDTWLQDRVAELFVLLHVPILSESRNARAWTRIAR